MHLVENPANDQLSLAEASALCNQSYLPLPTVGLLRFDSQTLLQTCQGRRSTQGSNSVLLIVNEFITTIAVCLPLLYRCCRSANLSPFVVVAYARARGVEPAPALCSINCRRMLNELTGHIRTLGSVHDFAAAALMAYVTGINSPVAERRSHL